MPLSTQRKTFSKDERLSSVSGIKKLFNEGRSFVIYPFKVLFLTKEGEDSPSILFTIPKRNFKRAVDRNYIKRRCKEIYRLNKSTIEHLHLNIAVIYLAKEKIPFNSLKNKLILGLDRLLSEVEK